MKSKQATLKPEVRKVSIERFKASDVGIIIKQHAGFYKDEYGFDSTFEEYVASGIEKFMTGYDPLRENIWVTRYDCEVVGSVGLVQVEPTIAQLRWFILDPRFQGQGIGRQLMETAIDFAKEKGYQVIFLWTVSLLDSARVLYRKFGFELSETVAHEVWGRHLIEERWELKPFLVNGANI